MKTSHLLILFAAVLVGGARAQSADPVPVVAAPATAATPVASKLIYSPRLPTAAELTTAAASQQLAIVRIEQTATQVTATYQSAGGATSTVTYRLLSSADASVAPMPAAIATVAPRPAYYEGYAPAYYYDYPYYWYPPVALRLGFGFGYRHWR